LSDLAWLATRLAGFGPYAAPLVPAGAPDREWCPLPTLWHEETPLPTLVERMRTALARAHGVTVEEVEPRVAASSVHLALAARLVSPVLAVSVVTGRTPVVADRLRVALGADHQVDTGWTYDERLLAEPAAVETLQRRLVDEAVVPLGEAVHRLTGLSRQIVTGNAASALRGAVTVIHGADPSLGPAAAALVDGLLVRPPLDDAGGIVDGRWRRRSCCLFYRLPRGGLCGDCVLL
jgi:ferric iron reductase protein FhuF